MCHEPRAGFNVPRSTIMKSSFRIIATVFEPSIERAIDVIGSLPEGVDGVELRVDRLDRKPSRADFDAVRNATRRELIVTRRTTADYGVPADAEITGALDAGFEWLDVEYTPDLDVPCVAKHRARTILSFHDFDGTPELPALHAAMKALDCAQLKIAVTPRGFSDNMDLLKLCADHPGEPLTVIGMGGGGLYSRILGPFFGSNLFFAATSAESAAAPGQLTLHEALEIFGHRRECGIPKALFAVVGNPASHSRSPMIHNKAFFDREICAAYSIVETTGFDEVAESFARGDRFAPSGLSVTAPFKAEAFRFARKIAARLTVRAAAAGAVNTLVRTQGPKGPHVVADNTDVDGFLAGFDALAVRPGSRAALIGAGGTARAALVAAREAGIDVTLYNRSESRGQSVAAEFAREAKGLGALASFDGVLVMNTIRAGEAFDPPASLFRDGVALIDVGYGGEQPISRMARDAGMRVFDGLQFLEAQAAPQSRMFVEAVQAK